MDQRGYQDAAAVLPLRLRREAMALPEERQALAEELRLRVGRAMTVLLPEGEVPFAVTVEQEDLEGLCNIASDFSRYAAAESLRRGYLSVRGGCRVGLCGSAVLKEGETAGLRDFSSAAIRIPRERKGIGEALAPGLFREGRFCSTLLLSPPGGGKTTLLRDLIRCLSGGIGCPETRVALADERGEVAVSRQGRAQMDLGPRTDILDGCPKAQAIPMLLRCMNPQVIAVDEITAEEDIQAMAMAANCGVGLLATIHAQDVRELGQKPLTRLLRESGAFSRAIVIGNKSGERTYRWEELTP